MKCSGGASRVQEHSLSGGYLAGKVGLVIYPREKRGAIVFPLVHLAISTKEIKQEKYSLLGYCVRRGPDRTVRVRALAGALRIVLG